MKKQIILIIMSLFLALNTFAQKKEYTTYRVSEKETITSISRKLGITPYNLLKLNPDANNGINVDEVLIVPKKEFKVKSKVSTVRVTKSIAREPLKFTRTKKDSIVDGYLYHKVKAYETLYSLSRKYKVSKRKVRKINKLNRRADLSIGQILKFPTKLKNSCPSKIKETPVKIVEATELNQNFFTYTVQSQDTFYGLTRKFNISKDKLIELNPTLINGLKAGSILNIPSIKNNEVTKVVDTPTLIEPTYRTHKVVEKEGFYRLEQLYGFTKEEIIAANPLLNLEKGLKVDMVINIPNKESELNDIDIAGKSLNVVLMLPLDANSGIAFDAKSKKAKLLNKTTDFYLGSLMAFEDLKTKGLSINVKVLDTKKQSESLTQQINKLDLSNTDVVIGPLMFSSYKKVSSILDSKNIPVISPVSMKDHAVINRDNVIQNSTTNLALEAKILEHISKNYTNQQQLIIISSDTEYEKKNTIRVKNYLLRNDSIKTITVMKMNNGYIERELLEKSIKPDKENLIILTTNKKNDDFDYKVKEVTESLGALGEEFKVSMFVLKKPKKIAKIETRYLNRLNFQYPVSNFIFDDNVKVYTFKQNYRSKYGDYPSDFSFKGYDTTYDALMRLAIDNNYKNAFNNRASKRLGSKFVYKNKIEKGLYNDAIYIIKYKNYELIEVK
ncbi:MAG: LysM peptidoglycan-binding domain-containing protein [Flavobacteriaceae bacterium]